MNKTMLIYCLVDGETPSRAFPIRIDSTDSIGDLKELIKVKKTPRFDDIAADELTLWQVSVPVTDDEDEVPIFLGPLKEKKKAFPTKLLSNFFDDPPKDVIHIMVQKPTTVAVCSKIMLRITLRTAPRKEVAWITDTKTATLNDLATVIFANFPNLPRPSTSDSQRIAMYHPELDSNDAFYPPDDVQLQTLLQLYLEKNISNVIVDVETPTKDVSTYTLSDVDMLFDISPACKGDLSHCPIFTPLSNVDLNADEHAEALDQLYLELANRIDTTPSSLLDDEDMCTYIAPILHHAAGLSKDKLKVRYKPRFQGSRGCGQADFSIDMKGVSLTDRATQVIVTKVKNKDFKSAVAQNMVLLESSLTQQQVESRKRKRETHDDGNNDDNDFPCHESLRCHGIVTDAHFWYFVECKFETTANSPLHYAKFRVCDLKSNTVFQKPHFKNNDMKKTFSSIAGLLASVVDNKRKRTKSESL